MHINSDPQPINNVPLLLSLDVTAVTVSGKIKGLHCCIHLEAQSESDGVRPKTCTFVPYAIITNVSGTVTKEQCAGTLTELSASTTIVTSKRTF